jgi:hypothetical protein
MVKRQKFDCEFGPLPQLTIQLDLEVYKNKRKKK